MLVSKYGQNCRQRPCAAHYVMDHQKKGTKLHRKWIFFLFRILYCMCCTLVGSNFDHYITVPFCWIPIMLNCTGWLGRVSVQYFMWILSDFIIWNVNKIILSCPRYCIQRWTSKYLSSGSSNNNKYIYHIFSATPVLIALFASIYFIF